MASLPSLPWLWALLGVSWPRQSPHLYLAGVELLLSTPAVVICCKIALVGPFSRLHPIPSDGHTSQHRQQSVARKRARLFCNTVTNPRRAHRVWATQRSRQSINFFPATATGRLLLIDPSPLLNYPMEIKTCRQQGKSHFHPIDGGRNPVQT